MTATQIIDEIKRLDPKEQAGVVRFVYQLDAERKLSGPELSTLAERLVKAFTAGDRLPKIRRRPCLIISLIAFDLERSKLKNLVAWPIGSTPSPTFPPGNGSSDFPE